MEDEYIPGGFANLDQDLEEELLNDFDDEFDSTNIRRSQYLSSLRPSEPVITVTRSPVELWQRARILIAIYLYKVPNSLDDTAPVSTIIDPSVRKMIDENKVLSNGINQMDYIENFLEHKENIEDQRIHFGLIILKQFSLDSSEQYQNVDFYDVEQGYIIISNVINTNTSNSTLID